MSTSNGYRNGVGSSGPSTPGLSLQAVEYTPEKIKALIAELEIPFDPAVIEWRIIHTTKDGKRGLVIPYADQRAYTDRLNTLVSPAGWTRKYTVHTSANFQRSKDDKVVAKVFDTCDLTIFGIGSHSATGEEWADDDNAGTSAEAQAFKRACCCFGLGRYLYHFTGVWVDLDARKRPKTVPKLFGWATPEGWRRGLRPERDAPSSAPVTKPAPANGSEPSQSRNGTAGADTAGLVAQIEAMTEPLGKRMYRGLLRTLARAWNPREIRDTALLEKVLMHMQGADRGFRRLDAALNKTGPEPLRPILDSLSLRSLEHVDSLETLQKIVVAMEAKAGIATCQS
jgi:hypothetical protein